jgi:hypothetical protein
MAIVLVPMPSGDFDPTEVAVSWRVLKQLSHEVVFATPDGRQGQADDIMLTGQGLDFWGFVPGLRHLVAFGRIVRANVDARQAYAEMLLDPAFKAPLAWRQLRVEGFDGRCHGVSGLRSHWRPGSQGDDENQLWGYRFPPEIIQQAIWLYLRFTLSFRDVEDLLAERGIAVSYETVRRWVNSFRADDRGGLA